MTVPSSAKADPTVTPRLKSALLWGAVAALFFLVLHQAYLLLDGEFLGVGPVAAVAVGVFAATVVASYLTDGHLEGFEPDEAAVEAPEAGTSEPATGAERESEPASEPATGTDTTGPIADGSVGDDAETDGTEAEQTEVDETEADEPDDDTADDPEDEWIWGGQDGQG